MTTIREELEALPKKVATGGEEGIDIEVIEAYVAKKMHDRERELNIVRGRLSDLLRIVNQFLG